jgi:hypothetical protein
MDFVQVINSEPVAEKHLCWFVVEGEKDYTFVEIVEEAYLNPASNNETIVTHLSVRVRNTYNKRSSQASVLAMMKHAENAGKLFCRRAGYSLEGDIIRVNDSEGRLPLISEFFKSSQK